MSTTMGKDIHVVSMDVEAIAAIKKRGNIAHVSSFLTLTGVIHFPSVKFPGRFLTQLHSSRTETPGVSIEGTSRNISHIHSKWLSISLPPRI